MGNRFREETDLDVSSDTKAKARLLEAAEIASMELSTSTSTRINLPFLAAVRGEPKHLEYEPTHSTLERLVRRVIERCCDKVKLASVKQDSSAKLPMRRVGYVWKNDD